MNALVSDAVTVVLLLVIGFAFGLVQWRNFDPRWLIAGVGLVWLNSALLLRGYNQLPELLGSTWNWEGKVLALAGTLTIAALPTMTWASSGLRLDQRPGSLRAAIPVALLYCLLFAALAYAFPSDPPTHEALAFQLTMPGLEEEPFYRGVLLLAFDRAYRGRVRLFGVDWGFGALLSCIAFGLAHAFSFSGGVPAFSPMVMALTALPALIAVWLRYRTGSLVLPILLHNFGNAIGLLL